MPIEPEPPPFLDADKREPVVLLVEDEVLTRFSLADHLLECGFVVREAQDAKEAIELLQAGAKVDVVFSDVRMPGDIDGFGLARWVRANRPQLQVFLASGNVQKSEIISELCEENRFFAKPYDLAEVANCIRSAVARS